MKVVIVGVNAEGRSHVESSRALPDAPLAFLWDEPDLQNLKELIAGADPSAVTPDLEPVPGGFKWMYFMREPDSRSTRSNRGTHVTRTIDFNFVISGRQECVLDEETVELEAGDVIILKAAAHLWRNTSEEPSAMLYMLHTPIFE